MFGMREMRKEGEGYREERGKDGRILCLVGWKKGGIARGRKERRDASSLLAHKSLSIQKWTD